MSKTSKRFIKETREKAYHGLKAINFKLINTRSITGDLENVYQSIHTNNNVAFKTFIALEL